MKALIYAVFRKLYIPAIAERYEITDHDIVLSKFASVNIPGDAIFDEVLSEKEDSSKAPATEDEKKAAIKLQTLSRQKSAANEIKELKQVI